MSALPNDLARPDYGVNTLAELLPAVVQALAVPGLAAAGSAASLSSAGAGAKLAEAFDGASRAIVFLVDGLGADLVRQHAHLAPALASMMSPLGDWSAPCPSTTPVSLATLGTGAVPGAHGVLGFVTDIPGEDRSIHHTHWRDDPDPDVWQQQPTVFEQLAAAGVATTVAAGFAYNGSGLTRAVYRGAKYEGTFTPGDLTAVALSAAAETQRSFVYAYYPELDTTGHVRGVDSPNWRAQLGIVDKMVEQLRDGLPSDTALVVTADHGMLDVSPDDRLDIDTTPELMVDVRLLAGEPRARYVYAVPGAAADVLARWQDVVGDRAWVVSRDEAVAAGIFGPVSDDLVARIGDVVALARGGNALIASTQERIPSILRAYHGSLTPTELAIPLLVARS